MLFSTRFGKFQNGEDPPLIQAIGLQIRKYTWDARFQGNQVCMRGPLRMSNTYKNEVKRIKNTKERYCRCHATYKYRYVHLCRKERSLPVLKMDSPGAYPEHLECILLSPLPLFPQVKCCPGTPFEKCQLCMFQSLCSGRQPCRPFRGHGRDLLSKEEKNQCNL